MESHELLVHFKYFLKPMNSNAMFFCACGANNSSWIKITIIIVFALISSLLFSREAYGSVKQAILCPRIQRG